MHKKTAEAPRLESYPLSPAELAVAKLVLKGMSSQEISKERFTAVKTTKFHITEIYRKCGVKTRAQLLCKFLPQLALSNMADEIERLQAHIAELERLLGQRAFEALAGRKLTLLTPGSR